MLTLIQQEWSYCNCGGELRLLREVSICSVKNAMKLHETINFIYAKLGEAERDNTTRLMKIADMIRA